ncbi:hypothetical protein [Hymenobacter wooponensis]|uniref:Uncharacterized protein n=1 Tax=Hymenobacter wooponensis TaxID=1525360 RepID=A0A4Z0MPP7_9BACT|nr:hypothetical protein [Hymenobacter wooponensis]TGD81862.1 hypothetical protein EU557_10045 [Hymenobacter wooponensis]
MEENLLCQVWKTVRVEAGPQPFQGYYSLGENMLFDFRYLDVPQEKPAVATSAHWTRHAEKITHVENQKPLYLLVQAVTQQYLVLELHMLYADQDRHTLTLKLVPNAIEEPALSLAATARIPEPVLPGCAG